MEDWKQRIHDVLGDDNERSFRNSMRWRTHLLGVLPLPIRVTGIEDFSWEEPYIFGGWDQQEYEKLKKTRPSYTDVFQLLDIQEPKGYNDLIAKLRRVSDGKVFYLGLSWLRTEHKIDPMYMELHNYSVWHCNY